MPPLQGLETRVGFETQGFGPGLSHLAPLGRVSGMGDG
jgi:hypothetical protein